MPDTQSSTIDGRAHRTIIRVIAALIGLAAGYLLRGFHLQPPSISDITRFIASLVVAWTSSTAVTSVREFAIITCFTVSIASFYLNWRYHESESRIISSIIDSPDIEIWLRIISRYQLNRIVKGWASIMFTVNRFYLWAIFFATYLYYVINYLSISQNPLWVSWVTVVLASLTFGAIFGRAEKGLVLAFKNKMESCASREITQDDRRTTLYTLAIMPLSLTIASGITYFRLNIISDANLGVLISIGLSVFISTFLVVLATLYLLWSIHHIIGSGIQWHREFRESGGTYIQLTRQKLKTDLDELRAWNEDKQSNSVFPDEVADALRKSGKE